MKLDCTNLACPEPVIRVKNALNENDSLEVVLNSVASVQNVKRFCAQQGHQISVSENGDESVILITKSLTCEHMYNEASTIFLKDDKIGKGKLGKQLIIGFLNTMNELDNPPKQIICVNRGVFLTSKNKDSIKALKSLEQKGCKIYSCGVCLDFFKLDVKVGEIGNAYFALQMLTQDNGVLSL